MNIKYLLGLLVNLCKLIFYAIPEKPFQIRWWWMGVWIKVLKVYIYHGRQKALVG